VQAEGATVVGALVVGALVVGAVVVTVVGAVVGLVVGVVVDGACGLRSGLANVSRMALHRAVPSGVGPQTGTGTPPDGGRWPAAVALG
jgi:hypothetical protein